MQFEVWAPQADRSTLHRAGAAHAMERDPERPGWWTVEAEASDGTRYGFAVDDGPVLPDPRSRRQPDGPDGLSAVVDHARYAWRASWSGRGLPGAVLYELHVGTYTPEGTLDAAAGRLGHLVELGVTHVELMPLCPFPGTHGWGYEGVSLWAVHEPYGGPEALKRFVDAAHGLGLGVVLDVVHNHLGPSGNYLPVFGPYFTERHHTPWGAAVNLDAPGSDEVRAYFLESALAWLRDYRLDGLRLDAVHALKDTRALHFLEELSTAVDALADEVARPLFLIAESDLNDPRLVTPRAQGGLGLHAQWNDDFHHTLHTTLTGEAQGYYEDFARAGLAGLAKTLTGGYFHDGTYSSFRERRHGRPLDRTSVSAHRLLGYTQTHDQVGNRAQGDRLAASLSPGCWPARPRWCSRARSRRCSSWARSGRRPRPGSSSRTTPIRNSRRRFGGGGAASSRRTGGPRRTSPTPRTRRPVTAPASTGPSRRVSPTPGCWPGTAPSSPSAAPSPTCPTPTSPTSRSRSTRRPGGSASGVGMCAWR